MPSLPHGAGDRTRDECHLGGVLVTPADEGRHEATTDPWWAEHFVFDLWAPDGALGAFTWMTLLPVQRKAWYWCALVRVGHPVLHVADIDTYHDHRVAMCFGMLGLRVPGMRLIKPACVRKTFPNYFAKLAELGAVIRDVPTGKNLSGNDLLA